MASSNRKAEVVTYYREHDLVARYTTETPEGVERLQRFCERYEEYIGTTVLDLGCGGGVLGFLLERAGRQYTGIDINPDMIREATAEAQRRGSNARFIAADLADLQTLESLGTFDSATVLGNALCHIETSQMLRMLARLSPRMQAGAHFIVDYRDIVALLFDRKWRMQTQEDHGGRITEALTVGCDTVSGRIEQTYGPAGGAHVHHWGHAIWAPFIIEPLFAAHGWNLIKRTPEGPCWTKVYRLELRTPSPAPSRG